MLTATDASAQGRKVSAYCGYILKMICRTRRIIRFDRQVPLWARNRYIKNPGCRGYRLWQSGANLRYTRSSEPLGTTPDGMACDHVDSERSDYLSIGRLRHSDGTTAGIGSRR